MTACNLAGTLSTNPSDLSFVITRAQNTAKYNCNVSASAAHPHISPDSVFTSPGKPLLDSELETQSAIPESPSRSILCGLWHTLYALERYPPAK